MSTASDRKYRKQLVDPMPDVEMGRQFVFTNGTPLPCGCRYADPSAISEIFEAGATLHLCDSPSHDTFRQFGMAQAFAARGLLADAGVDC